jgi:dTDP-4-dehydrorhamnose 3,5-epimerase-like enzyme
MGFRPIGTAARGLRAPGGQQLLRQTYETDAVPKIPDGVVLIPQRIFPDDSGGSFKEVARLADGAVQVPALRERGITHTPAQINISIITPGTTRFWHVHPTQNEIWTVSYGQLNAGLVDCRDGSPTFGVESKIILTPHIGLYIPAGVAHGYANESSELVVLHYLPDRQFSTGDDSEEWRIDPDALPYDFVLAETI